MARPVHRPFHMAEHDRRGSAEPHLCAVLITSSHSPGLDLVGAQGGADFIVENLRGRSRQRSEADALQLGQKFL